GSRMADLDQEAFQKGLKLLVESLSRRLVHIVELGETGSSSQTELGSSSVRNIAASPMEPVRIVRDPLSNFLTAGEIVELMSETASPLQITASDTKSLARFLPLLREGVETKTTSRLGIQFARS